MPIARQDRAFRSTPSIGFRNRRPAIAAGSIPPGVAQLEAAATKEGGSDPETSVNADHQRREKTAPRTSRHANSIFVDLGPAFEIGHGLQQRHGAVVDRSLMRIIAEVQARVDRIIAGRAITWLWKVDAQRCVASLGSWLGRANAGLT